LFQTLRGFLEQLGISFTFPASDNIFDLKQVLAEMMGAFEAKYPTQGLLLVIVKNYELRITNYELKNWKGIWTPTNFENYELTNYELATSSPPDSPNQKGSPWLRFEPQIEKRGFGGERFVSPNMNC